MTVTPTPTHTPASERIQGDVNCDGDVDEADFDFLLHFAADLNDGQTPGDCPNLGDFTVVAAIAVFPWGDVNCDSAVDAIDALFILAHTAGIEMTPVAPSCSESAKR